MTKFPTPPEERHVVCEFDIGNTHIKICDDYCRDKTPEDVQAALDRIAAIYYREWINGRCKS